MTTVSLVLGTGGARGYAHIGVIEELEARGYQVTCIAGCSMGALVGGLYAAGGMAKYRAWVETLRWIDVVRLLDLNFRNTLFNGDKVFAKLRELIGDPSIETLPVSYTAVATDLSSNKEIWFQRGSLLQAMRASIAIPGIVSPVISGDRVLVDGGVLNPLPIVATVAAHADLIIAVDVNASRESVAMHLDPEDLAGEEAKSPARAGRFAVLLNSMEVMQGALTRYKIAGYSPDLVIRVPKEAGGFHEFHRATALIDIGRRMACRQLDLFEELAEVSPDPERGAGVRGPEVVEEDLADQ
ncbi:patatin-like phospholipase family protein [Marinobacterium sp. D7]|uniref:patatin-like phospholipase family protein n=1 Tax=Marinobacterium ramblicola TaxID=2849041 RepID=UPI001C2D54E2|nr:patatin-like phospholipase family protein [Marinobacterium ramblicola]MBV1786530.1 patatin-like phospholipase family protein [Marinobacterium ramblicola]